MKKHLLIPLMVFAVMLGILYTPNVKAPTEKEKQETLAVEAHQVKLEKVVAYLQTKNSPLTRQEVSLLVKQKHGDLLIAISAIESQYCKHQLGYNCWGIGGDSAYRHYKNFSEAIIDANNLIEKWQARGRWLTVEDMNCHYVQPCNENWVRTVNKVLQDIESF
mgnify:CR=1 FL=1